MKQYLFTNSIQEACKRSSNATKREILTHKAIEGIKSEDVVIDSSFLFEDVCNLIYDMVKICVENNGIGLAAPQVGINRNLFVILDPTTRTFTAYINPSWSTVKLTDSNRKTEKTEIAEEGCLSVMKAKQSFRISRHKEILASWHELSTTENNVIFKRDILITGFRARVFQHEYEHLIGGNIVNTFLKQQQKQKKLTRKK